MLGAVCYNSSPAGLLPPVGFDMTRLSALLCLVLSATVPASLAAADRVYHFENDIEPLLSRYACNSSGCHGKAEGQNGFRLSVFGFDPVADHGAFVKEARGRRINTAAPTHSLLLRKVSGQVAHGGGTRIRAGSDDYETLRGWIAAGAPLEAPNAPRLVTIRLEPSERVLPMKSDLRLRVIAKWSHGADLDVTRHARFQSNNDGLAIVSAEGIVTTLDAPGDAAIMASYLGQVATFRALIPLPKAKVKTNALPTFNFIDRLVDQKLDKLHIEPSPLTDDAEFVRRVFLDIIGTLPTPWEVRAFLGSTDPKKRAKLVDELLNRTEFADYWALRWSDLLRVDRQALGHQRAYAFYKWIRASIAANKPLDHFARELLTAEGPLAEIGPANFYRVATKPGEMASSLSQVFLGVRIACAECHHHPFDRWTQNDYYGMVAHFGSVRFQGDVLTPGDGTDTINPRTGEKVLAHGLGQALPAANVKGDRRIALADWMTSPDNPYFARNLANRVWAHFVGRGLVEPVDDVRGTNPPTNPELLEALAKNLIENKFDLRALIRTIAASRVYQTSSRPNATNDRDEQNHSRALLKRIDAEVLFDMINQTTGVAEKFDGVPEGTRAIQLWDSKIKHYFLKQFGRPQRVSACECERVGDPNVAQVLHFLNAPELQAKLAHEGGNVAKWVRTIGANDKLVEEMYLAFFGRLPENAERKTAIEFLEKRKSRRREAAEDLAWSLMNSLEFRFNH